MAVTMKHRGKVKQFANLDSAVEYMQESLKDTKLDERLTLSLPNWLKDELRDRKHMTKIPMSKQALSFLLRGTYTK